MLCLFLQLVADNNAQGTKIEDLQQQLTQKAAAHDTTTAQNASLLADNQQVRGTRLQLTGMQPCSFACMAVVTAITDVARLIPSIVTVRNAFCIVQSIIPAHLGYSQSAKAMAVKCLAPCPHLRLLCCIVCPQLKADSEAQALQLQAAHERIEDARHTIDKMTAAHQAQMAALASGTRTMAGIITEVSRVTRLARIPCSYCLLRVLWTGAEHEGGSFLETGTGFGLVWLLQ